MQQEYNMLKREHNKVMRAADRYREELHQKNEELKGASDLLASCQQSLLAAENEQEMLVGSWNGLGPILRR